MNIMSQCPKCKSTEVITDLALQTSGDLPSFVKVSEPDPPNKPFIWIAKSEQSYFTANVCGACGYTEFYATNYKGLSEGRKKGYKNKLIQPQP